jgi:hypothetical protein
MPTLTKTWTFDIARANGDSATNQDRTAAWMMWYIKSCLTGQGGYMPATLGDATTYVTPPVFSAATITPTASPSGSSPIRRHSSR